jgi:hypothetical protein
MSYADRDVYASVVSDEQYVPQHAIEAVTSSTTEQRRTRIIRNPIRDEMVGQLKGDHKQQQGGRSYIA